MAINYSKASGNKVLKEISKKSEEQYNTDYIVNIGIEKIHPNEDNRKVFNMDKIKQLASSIDENGFTGAIEVFKISDDSYEISAGHRRYEACKMLGMKTIPCIITANKSDTDKAKKLILSNINNRELTAIDKARAIDYYRKNVLADMKGSKRNELMRVFDLTNSQLYRFEAISRLNENLQSLCAVIDFPFTGITGASTLTDEQQNHLYDDIMSTIKTSGMPSRKDVERMIEKYHPKEEIPEQEEKLQEVVRALPFNQVEDDSVSESSNKPITEIKLVESGIKEESLDFSHIQEVAPKTQQGRDVKTVDNFIEQWAIELTERSEKGYIISDKEKAIGALKRMIKLIEGMNEE